MGVLLQPHTGRRFTLAARTLVGRSVACTLSLTNPRVSGEHAALFYSDDGWALRDLGSSNGTRVNGQPLGLGERRALEIDDELLFADERWVFEDDGRPVATGRDALGNRRRADDDLLALPDADEPLVFVYASSGGRWVMERGDRLGFVTDGERLPLPGGDWVLELPALTEGGGTANTLQDTNPHHFDMIERLHVAISRDEETIELTVHFARDRIELGHRSHNYLIVPLARQMLADAALPAAERGWMYLDRLSHETDIGQDRMYVEVYRARRHFREVGIEGSAPLFERRSHTRQIRLGIRNLTIGRLADPD